MNKVLSGELNTSLRSQTHSTFARLIAELFGTFCLVFAGTGAIVVNDISHGAITHLGIAITFGLIVMAMIYTLGDVSGAHLNPAVTIAFWASKRFAPRMVLPFIVSQLLGSLLASAAVRLLFGKHSTLGSTQPAGAWMQSFILEWILTLILMFVILRVSTGAKEKGITAGFAVGSIIALAAIFGGPISGASMNPARSIGPAVISGNLELSWIYVLAPIAGSLSAVILSHFFRKAK